MQKKIAPLTVNVISDIHAYSPLLGTSGEEFVKADAKTPNDLKHNKEILAALSRQLIKSEAEVVLVSGDLTFNAEPESHELALSFLRSLKEGGKRVFVITATHDYRKSGKTFAYRNNGRQKINSVLRSSLFEMYRDFGLNEAIAVHRSTMSYVAQLCDGYRLFALNDDDNGEGTSGFSDEFFEWITAQIKKAKSDGQFIITMTHHPMIPPSPLYGMIADNDVFADWKKRCSQLADMGVPFALTGHTHMDNISYTVSPTGNIFYDITTASPVGFPATYRALTFSPSEGKIEVHSREIEEEVSFKLDGENLKAHLENKFFGLFRELLDSAAYDTKKLSHLASRLGIDKKQVYRFGYAVKPFARLLCSLKIKHAAMLCRKESGVSKEDLGDIKNERVVDFVFSVVKSQYEGDAPYHPEKALSKVALGVCSVADSVLDALRIKPGDHLKNAASVKELVEPLLFNSGIPDRDAVLTLYPLCASGDPFEAVPVSTVKKSRKGGFVIASFALCTVLLFPVLLVYLVIGFFVNALIFRKESGKQDENKKAQL